MTERQLLGKELVWTTSCPIFTGDFDPVANFLTLVWSDTEGRAYLSTRRAMSQDNVNDSEFQVSQTPVFLKRHHLMDGL